LAQAIGCVGWQKLVKSFFFFFILRWLGPALAYQQSDVLRLPVDRFGCTSFGFAVATQVPCVGAKFNLHSPEFRC